ncbi:hypothetical protein [Desulfospira joergensenii]|uniref:hypothetical protein n=1 Tax=Desulfospira joergensenii TaxID=53329 RepID=UPI0003B750EA|nr:hypothetical protein [Desulfospira joergensenii]
MKVSFEAYATRPIFNGETFLRGQFCNYQDFKKATKDILNAVKLAAILDLKEHCTIEIEDEDEFTIIFNILSEDEDQNSYQVGSGRIYQG